MLSNMLYQLLYIVEIVGNNLSLCAPLYGNYCNGAANQTKQQIG